VKLTAATGPAVFTSLGAKADGATIELPAHSSAVCPVR
jgi:hypothetical protein